MDGLHRPGLEVMRSQARGRLEQGSLENEDSHSGPQVIGTNARKKKKDPGIYCSCWYLRFMLVFTIHAGIYDSCWYLRFMLVFTIHSGIYGVPFVSKLKMMLVFTIHAGIYTSCWYLRYQHEV